MSMSFSSLGVQRPTHIYKNATENRKRAQTEMGGKNPVIVSETANLAEAVEIVADGAFGYRTGMYRNIARRCPTVSSRAM